VESEKKESLPAVAGQYGSDPRIVWTHVTAPPSCEDAEIDRFLARVPSAAIFPLVPIIDGRCGCSPKCARIGKHPAMYWSLLVNEEKIPGEHGHGIATGARSLVFVVETDQKEGVDGEENLLTLGTLPRTLTIVSPSRSRHRYFRMPQGRRVETTAGEIAPCVDVRGDGGFAVLAGSPHRLGGHYRVEDDVEIADAPEWLLEKVCEADAATDSAAGTPSFTSAILTGDETETLVQAIVAHAPPQGDRNEWRMTVANLLLACGHSVEGAEDVVTAVAFKLGADAVEFSACVRSTASHREAGGNSKGWPSYEELVGVDGKKALSDAINPRKKEREQACLDALRRTPKVATEIARARDLADKAEDRLQSGEATPAWVLDRGDAVEIADQLQSVAKDIVFTEGAFYKYDNSKGIWTEHDARRRLLEWIWSMSGAAVNDKALKITKSLQDHALEIVGERLKDDDFFKSAVNGIACPNGFLHVSENGASLVPHAREHRAREAFPIEYDANAKSATWEKFLDDLFRDDADKGEKIAVIGEFFGASLFGFVTRFQRALIQLGEGSNGKSTILEVVRGVYPKGSTCTIQPQKLSEEYWAARLKGKLLNVVPDLRDASFHETQEFKSAVVGDPIGARDPGGLAGDIHPVAGQAFGANDLPPTGDQSHGFWSRWIVVRFNREFKRGGTNMAELLLKTEKPAIFAWLVDSAVRLLKNGGYTLPSSHDAAQRAWRDASDPVATWVSDACEKTSSPAMSTEELYPFFAEWLRTNGYKQVTSRTFGSNLNKLGVDKTGAQHRRSIMPKDRNAQMQFASRVKKTQIDACS
jgi:P4 family phage/plasmid primase-like protien